MCLLPAMTLRSPNTTSSPYNCLAILVCSTSDNMPSRSPRGLHNTPPTGLVCRCRYIRPGELPICVHHWKERERENELERASTDVAAKRTHLRKQRQMCPSVRAAQCPAEDWTTDRLACDSKFGHRMTQETGMTMSDGAAPSADAAVKPLGPPWVLAISPDSNSVS